MPIVSKRQNRFFRAREHDKGKLGKVAREFIKATPAKAFKRMPEAVKAGKPTRADKWYGGSDK
jgi:hypothetical protein